MTVYIPTIRRFALSEEKHLRDPDYRSYLGAEPKGIFKWQELLKLTPVVVLGEGRSGKTCEFEEQVRILKDSGNFAFFVPLERLHDEMFSDALAIEDAEAFELWKKSPSAIGYFFLDALDELKLREGTLRKAVKKLRRSCEPHFARMKLVLSCRPADWMSQIDSQLLAPFSVQPLQAALEVEALDSDAAFLEVISESKAVRGPKVSKTKPDELEFRSSPTIVTLLPLSKEEIRAFSQDYSAGQANEFCGHIEAKDLWHLYRLPAEIIDALDQMTAGVPLGSLEDQLRRGIQHKLQEKVLTKPRALSVDKAWEGAERIALALFLLKRGTLKVDGAHRPDALDISDILTDWTADEQRELIGKPLFDPSGVGFVRFHHRATQEYLAAKRLEHFRESGMHERELFAILFSEIGGEEVVKPSMAPVAAWLALWHADIRKVLLMREPGLLFRQGLPSSLSMDVRAEVLRAYVLQYAGKDWCRTGFGHEEIRRVAHGDLAPVVRELWEDGYTGHDSRELLLEMIEISPMPSCTDLALEAVWDDKIAPHHRTRASYCVLAAGTGIQKEGLVTATQNLELPQDVIRQILPKMVPKLIGVDEFFKLLDRLDNPSDSTLGLNYMIYKIVKDDGITRNMHITFRDRLTEAIWSTRQSDCRMHHACSENDHYQDGLIVCCNATIPEGGDDPARWARALAIALHFGERDESVIDKLDAEAIWEALEDNSNLRETLFWACLDLADEMEAPEGDLSRFISASSVNLRSFRSDTSDLTWLLNAVRPTASSDRRGVAFHAITRTFDISQDETLAATLREHVIDREDWTRAIQNILHPMSREPDEFELKMRAHKEARRAKETQRIAGWCEWRADVLRAPDYLMGGNRRVSILYDASKIIKQGIGNDNNWGEWNGAIIARTLGEDFLKRYRQELSEFWRETDVQLASERSPNERSSYGAYWLLALAGVKAEAETIGWATSLSHEEAVRAARIACIELNGFGGYVAALEEAHPNAVAYVVAEEAHAEVKQLSETGQAAIFHDVLYYGTENMKAAVATRIAPHLSTFNSSEQEGAQSAFEYAICIIAEKGDACSRDLAIAMLCQELERGCNFPRACILSFLAILSPEVGCIRLLQETEDLNTSEDRANAIEAFAKVFGGRHSHHFVNLDAIPENRRVSILQDLVRRVYQVVRREEDTHHEDVYSPGARDNAQDARSLLLDSLLSIKCLDTLAALHELAKQPEFGHMSDRLRQVAYEVAGQISDITAHPLSVVQAMDQNLAFIPYDHRSLLSAVMTRLDSFGHDILYADDTPIVALRRLDQETDLRRFIANWLRGRDRGVFEFTQEAVVVDEKRTDIRFHPRAMPGYATVELKRETWSVRDFEKALRTQLVGQYLQHERCRVGVLLLCQANTKYWLHPDTQKRMTLEDVVGHLNRIAGEIMAERPELQIVVKGIDYS